MIQGRRDTIAAIATPAGSGGVGVVRVSGEQAVAIAAGMIGRPPASLLDRQMVLGVARRRDGTRLDEVLVVAMRSPRSYTGEDVTEIHGHGGSVNMSQLLREVVERGARHAEPGEFTRRAFENGRLDLTRAEAVLDVIGASSERALRNAQAQLDGALGRHLADLRARVTALCAEVEACIDFPEEGNDYLREAEVEERATALGGEVRGLASTFALGRALRDGVDVVIAGPVNSGKSSLFNSLLGRERALVAAEPGTTRDVVDASATWSGIEVRLVDTAGERATESEIERRGMELGRAQTRRADLIIDTWPAGSSPLVGENVIHVRTKADLHATEPGDERLATSAVTGQGIDALRELVIARATATASEGSVGHIVTSERQRTLLLDAAVSLDAVQAGTRAGQPIEVIAADLREAGQRLAEAMGEQVGDEVLDQLFARFCIGK